MEDGPTGYGLLVKPLGEENMITANGSQGDHALVFQGEVVAVHKTALLLHSKDHGPVHFFIDSKATILALTKKVFTSRTVHDCYLALLRLAKTDSVTLHWVKAHVNHPLNEQADELAKQGTESDNLTNPPRTWASIKTELSIKLLSDWNKRWST